MGGCPFAKNSTGNVATEDLVYMLNGINAEHGVNIEKLLDASVFVRDALAIPIKSNVALAMLK